MFIMGNMALLWGGYGIFSDLLIVFRFPGLQAQYLGQNMPMIKGRISALATIKQHAELRATFQETQKTYLLLEI